MNRNSLSKKGFVVAVIFLFLGMCVTPSMGTVTEKKFTMPTSFYDGDTLYVGGDGSGNYIKVQDTVDHTSSKRRIVSSIIEDIVLPVPEDDELDQYQTDYYGFSGFVGSHTGMNWSKAQSFIPTKKVLTRVQLYIKRTSASCPYVLVIRDNLTGENIAMVGVNPSEIHPDHEWIEFDFDDVPVTVGQTYYIISYTANVTNNKYYWGEILYDGYPNGTAYSSTDNGVTWDHTVVADMCFKTYGRGSNILYVGGNGSGNYSSIQAAIDNASNRDTVFVYDDSSPYYENIVVDKSINLIGENKYSTIIDGGGIGKVVSIITDDVSFTGFTIQNSGSGPYMGGIDVYSNYSCISNNLVRWNDFFGIHLHYSNNNIIINNSINLNIEIGIDIFRSNNNTFSNNTISENRHGVELWFSNSNTIDGNYILNNGRGVDLYYSQNNSISDNKLLYNTNAIGLIYLSNYNTASGNIILTNWDSITFFKTGIKINRSEGNSIYRNSISQHMFGILLENSSLNKITCNNLIRNIVNAYFQSGVNTFNNNYWNRPRLLPKLILGTRTIGSKLIPWVQFDRHPAKMPYENGLYERKYEGEYV